MRRKEKKKDIRLQARNTVIPVHDRRREEEKREINEIAGDE